MKKRIISVVLVLLLAATLIPASAFAASPLSAPVISDVRVPYELGEEDNTNLVFTMTLPQDVKDAIAAYEAADAFEPIELETWVNVNNTGWNYYCPGNASSIYEGERWTGWDATYGDKDDQIQLKVRLLDNKGWYGDSGWSNILTLNAKAITSAWAETWVDQAEDMGLIPDCLVGQDLTQLITREEFAALAVRVYQGLTDGKTVTPGSAFADCSDAEVLKAVAIGITNGTDVAKNLFSPKDNITREQCAAMLARAYKAYAIKGWTLATDAEFADEFNALFTMPEPFADDKDISAYAKPSVYFMSANDIINGVGNNKFAPKHGATKGEAESYGLATREAAIKIAVGMVKNLK